MRQIFIFILCWITVSIPVIGQIANQSIETPVDTLLKKKLETIRMKDQTLRLVLPMVEEKFGKDSEEVKYFWSLINKQDSINEFAILEIIDNHGWVRVSEVGYLANQSLWLVIQHAPLNVQEKYLPYLKKSVEQGESEGWYLAFLEDRILMRNGKKQKYGTQAKFDKTTGKNQIYPIGNPESVNERRKKIGLEPIEEYAEKNGYIYVIQESNE